MLGSSQPDHRSIFARADRAAQAERQFLLTQRLGRQIEKLRRPDFATGLFNLTAQSRLLLVDRFERPLDEIVDVPPLGQP